MARAIDSEVAFRFLTEQLVKETGAFSKGVNKGLNIARSAMRNPDAIPILTPPNEWVSVEERLPEGHAQVLMWSAKWNIAEAGSYYNKHFWVYSEIGDGYIAEDITYWMPLPAPPGSRLEGGEQPC